jgi:hypothetical protein
MGTDMTAAVSHSTPPELWWIVFGIVCVGFCIYSIILTYHWFAYGLDGRVAWATSLFYYAVSVLLLFVLATSALTLSLT